ncbi:MAG TPA: sulfatase [Verrucomicrobiae bacterium]
MRRIKKSSLCAFVLACLWVMITPMQAAVTQPNVIIILADDLGWADLGCYGNTFNETPNIDKLAKQGMRFTQFYAGPVCSPTRANLMSGQDQARFGITQHIPGHKRPYAKLIDPVVPLQLPLAVETFAERLRGVGYQTGYMGKWHLGGAGFSPAEQGWSSVQETQGHTVTAKIDERAVGKRTTEFLTDKAVAFIGDHKAKPFLLQVSHHAVHIPLTTTPELLAKYQAKKAMAGYPSRPEYAGLLEELDRSVGRIMEAVDKAGIAGNTLILFLSDNGGLEHEQSGRIVTSNRPLRGEKGTLYEGGIRIPAIARWSGTVPAGTHCDTPAITMDVYPTLLELSKASAAEKQPQDGVSLAGVLKDPQAKLKREALHWHLPHYHHSTPASAVRKGDWKLIQFYETDKAELYNLKDDLGEKNDLAVKEAGRAKELKTALAEWRQKVKAQMPVPNPNHDPKRADELAKGKGKKGQE